jgi:hypothetical protein
LVLLKDPSCRDVVPELRCSTTEKAIQAMLREGAQLLSFCVIRKDPNNSVTDAATDVQAASSAKSQGQPATRKRSQVDRFQPEESVGSPSPRRKRKSSSANSNKKNSAVEDLSQDFSTTLSESSQFLNTQDLVDDAAKAVEKQKAPESKTLSKRNRKKQKVGTGTETSPTFKTPTSWEGTLSNKKSTGDTTDQEVCQAWDFTKEECNTFNESAERCRAGKTEEKATTALALEELAWAYSIKVARMMRQIRQIRQGDASLSRLEDLNNVKLSESELKEWRGMLDNMSRKKQWDHPEQDSGTETDINSEEDRELYQAS